MYHSPGYGAVAQSVDLSTLLSAASWQAGCALADQCWLQQRLCSPGFLIFQPASLGLFSCWWQGENMEACQAHDDWDWPKQATSQPRFQRQGNGPYSEEKILRVTGKGYNTGIENYGSVFAVSLTSLGNPS